MKQAMVFKQSSKLVAANYRPAGMNPAVANRCPITLLL